MLAALFERVLGLSPLVKVYDDRPANSTPSQFLQHTLKALGVSLKVHNAEFLEEIPATGPLLVVANHPLGGLEGVAVASVLSKIRSDVKVLTNQLLTRIPELSDTFIGVDVLSSNAASGNVSGIKQVHRHLKQGGAILIFPAGMVSALDLKHRSIRDRRWNRLVGQLVRRYEAVSLPVHVGGKNSMYFYAAGVIHPRLRTLLLPRQLSNKRGSELTLTIGKPIPPQELRHADSPVAITEYLRISTDALVMTQVAPKTVEEMFPECSLEKPDNALLNTIDGLKDCRLIEHDEFDVICAPFNRLGPIMEHIAIAREISFRLVGEGTGLSQDSDQFDPHYLHLFLWDKQHQRIAGAYRVGLVDKIVAEFGVSGLYSRSLYKYDNAFINKLGGAIEMGRSFVHPDYQRRPVALNLLWRGIGKILVENPQYHTLFGSVSISRQYSDLARSLIADTMLTNFRARGFEDLVKPITPHRIVNRVWSDEMLSELSNIKILSKLIGRCDPGKAVPVLLRHYLALKGRLVCFNIHSNFSNSLEGLIIVDLRQTDGKTASRFLGAEGYQHFMSFHRLQDSA
jgi:putative hemolysin